MIMEAISGRLQKEQAMLSYLAVFAVETLIGSLAMGLTCPPKTDPYV
jgi:hypothetical protein